eukprot:comp7573_c0_seq1/m.3224 comp7573_c0_seq1/g.3224  ORF comp7573_c0_seq1/g.3224 comp7573_c0_seq1/m.3224 type:complete len:327 (-) comp7573_c0_seq1:9-989(-)
MVLGVVDSGWSGLGSVSERSARPSIHTEDTNLLLVDFRELQIVTYLSVMLQLRAPYGVSTEKVLSFINGEVHAPKKLGKYLGLAKRTDSRLLQKYCALYVTWWRSAHFTVNEDIIEDLVADMHRHLSKAAGFPSNRNNTRLAAHLLNPNVTPNFISSPKSISSVGWMSTSAPVPTSFIHHKRSQGIQISQAHEPPSSDADINILGTSAPTLSSTPTKFGGALFANMEKRRQKDADANILGTSAPTLASTPTKFGGSVIANLEKRRSARRKRDPNMTVGNVKISEEECATPPESGQSETPPKNATSSSSGMRRWSVQRMLLSRRMSV